jgi:hypothetical protein
VQTWTWLANTCQQFRLDPVGDVLLADTTGLKVLDTPGCGAPRARTVVLAGRDKGSTCQLWRFRPTEEGYFQIVDKRAGRPLTATGDRLSLGRPGAATEWRIEPLNDGGYHLITRDGRAADLTTPPVTGAPGASPTQRLLLLAP